MANPNLRTVTGKSTVPSGTDQSGTFTALAGHTDKIEYSGTAAALNTILIQVNENTEQQKNNLWIYLKGTDQVLRIKSWGGKIITVDGDAHTASTSQWALVESKLSGWSVSNVGGATGKIGATDLAAGATVTWQDAPEATFRRQNADAIFVNGTSTTLLIEEFK
jgi:hypothetical protein